MSSLDVPLGPIAPRCANHPEKDASGTCSRCGTFFCAGCVRWVLGKPMCRACSARPEIGYLEQFRLKLWGRRDASSWVIGVVGVVLAVATVLEAGEQRVSWPSVLLLGAATVASGAFFLGMKWAREALVIVLLSCTLLCGLLGFSTWMLLFGGLFCATGVVYFDTRNRLFFQRPVSPTKLRRLWHVRENNPRARDAMNLGLASLFIPLFAPLAIILGVVALNRVDPDATPPIGRRGQALFGIVVGMGSLMMWGLLLSKLLGWLSQEMD